MRKRNIEKHFWFSEKEAHALKEKADKACIHESTLIRMLILGYRPKEKPGPEFYQAMRELNLLCQNLNQLTVRAHTQQYIDVKALKEEQRKWNAFQESIEKRFLEPEKEKDTKRWQ